MPPTDPLLQGAFFRLIRATFTPGMCALTGSQGGIWSIGPPYSGNTTGRSTPSSLSRPHLLFAAVTLLNMTSPVPAGDLLFVPARFLCFSELCPGKRGAEGKEVQPGKGQGPLYQNSQRGNPEGCYGVQWIRGGGWERGAWGYEGAERDFPVYRLCYHGSSGGPVPQRRLCENLFPFPVFLND